VVKSGGAVAVIDLLSPGEGAVGERYDAVERLRDPSHTRALTEAGFAALFAGQGLRVARERHRTVEVSVERWLDLTAPAPGARREVLGAFQAQLSGGPATGFELFRAEDGLRFRQRWAVYVLGE
jgi:hypothetical protein